MSGKLLLWVTVVAMVCISVAQDSPDIPIPEKEMDNLQTRLTTIASWGSRRTGSVAHHACIDWIADKFGRAGLKVMRDTHIFSLYDLSEENIGLSVDGENGMKKMYPSAAYPFSGLTDSAGVTGELVYIPKKQYGRSKGKIAVVEVPNKSVPTDALFDVQFEFPKGDTILPERIYNPVLSSTLFGPDLVKFRKAGALAVVAVWKNMTPGMAAGQYLPFTFPYKNLPALWMAGDDGRYVLDAAKKGNKASMLLNGTLDTAVDADNVWAMVEGENPDETILVISHSDGTNPVEENGFIGLISLAEKLKNSGKKPKRTVVFVVVAGHLRLPDLTDKKKEQATTIWLKEHPELWDGKKGHRKAVAGIVLEHLGAMEWADTKEGYLPTGKPEIEVVYATSEKMRHLVKNRWKDRIVPLRASIVTPRSIRHLGEGEPLFEAGIPAVALLGIPSYLLSEIRNQSPGITYDKASTLANPALVAEQCEAAYGVLNDLTEVPVKEFGKVKHVGLCGKICDIIKVIGVMNAKE